MDGFLTDGVRDLLATVGFAVAIGQTILAINQITGVGKTAGSFPTQSARPTKPAASRDTESVEEFVRKRRVRGERLQNLQCGTLAALMFLFPIVVAVLGILGYRWTHNKHLIEMSSYAIVLAMALLVAVFFSLHDVALGLGSRFKKVVALIAVHTGGVGVIAAGSSALLWASHQDHSRLNVGVADAFGTVTVAVAVFLPLLIYMKWRNV